MTIGQIVDIYSGGTPSTTMPDYWDGGIPWCTPTDITSNENKYISHTERTISNAGLKSSAAILMPEHSLLLCSRATIGEIKIATCPMATNQGFKNLVCHPGTDYEFMYYVLGTLKKTMLSKANGSTFLEISKSQLANIEISLPCYEIQRKIANVVSMIDSQISATRRLLAKYESLKKATVKLLMTPGKDWEKVPLGVIGEIAMCKRVLKSQTSKTGDIPFFKIGTFGKTPDAYISRQLFEEYKHRFSYPKKGDILLSAAGTIGRTVVFKGEDAYFQDSNIVWIVNDESTVSNAFLNLIYSNLNWQTENGGTVSRLYNANIQNTIVNIPPGLVQDRIVAIISVLEEKIIQQRSHLKKMQNIKQALLQYFFGD